MYRVGTKLEPKKSRWPLRLGVGWIVLCLLIGGIYLGTRVHPGTNITQAAPVTTKVSASGSTLKLFSQPSFEVKLPVDWKLQTHITGEYSVYRFSGTGPASSLRSLDVYDATMPVNFAVNRVQPVEATGTHLTATGSISDNCAEFTKAAPASGQAGTIAKWQNIDFLCDLHNTTRNVVGTSASGGINRVAVEGQDGQKHNFFLAYTDHGLNPDYAAFYSSIESFSAH